MVQTLGYDHFSSKKKRETTCDVQLQVLSSPNEKQNMDKKQ